MVGPCRGLPLELLRFAPPGEERGFHLGMCPPGGAPTMVSGKVGLNGFAKPESAGIYWEIGILREISGRESLLRELCWAQGRAGPWEGHPAIDVQSRQGSHKVSRSRYKVRKVQGKLSHLDTLVIYTGRVASLPAVSNFSPRFHKVQGAGPAPEHRLGTMRKRKELWALQPLTFQLRLTALLPQKGLGLSNVISTCRVLCNAQEEKPGAKGCLVSHHHSR